MSTTRQTRRNQISPAEQLELRVLPTVNVAFNPNSGLLKITGDNADNVIRVEGLGNSSQVRVSEIHGINITSQDFQGVTSIKANLKAGNDVLLLTSLRVDGNVTAIFGDGSDELDVDDGGIANGLTSIGGFLKANLGSDAGDRLDFDGAVIVYRDAVFTGVADVDFNGDGSGAGVQLDQDISFYSDLTINFSGFGDENNDGLELDFDNVNVRKETTLNGSDNVDRFEFTNSRFEGEFNADMNDGNDSIDVDTVRSVRNGFFGETNFRGGDGNDTLLKGLDDIFAGPEFISGFETVV